MVSSETKYGIDKRRGMINQWLPGFASGDAISNYAILLQRMIKGWGRQSEIFCLSRHVSPKVRSLCKDWDSYRDYSGLENIVIYHFSIGSKLSEAFKTTLDKKLLIYHNITPDKYLRSINTEKAMALYEGREELKELKDAPQLALADSEYNRLELEEWGYRNTGVLYPLMDFSGLSGKPARNVMLRYKDNWTNILFVGRITPNKKIEDVIRVFYYYKNTINPKSRLFIVGSFVGMEKYCSYLRALVLELNLGHVIFTGHIGLLELIAYYRLADVFLCMSEHEGFCIPLVESMYFGVPVIAYTSAAVPYTLAGSGLLVKDRNYPEIAELVDLVLSRDSLRREIISAQKNRLMDFDPSKIEVEFRKYIENM